MITLIYLTLILSPTLLANENKWDYLLFTQTWPNTFCKFNECNYPKDLIKGWSIHGLWPSVLKGKDPHNCYPNVPFEMDNLKSIYNELIVQWANLLNFKSPLSFWKHEWSKHGTCCLKNPLFPSELSFFQKGLVIKSTISLDKIFQNNQIIPSVEKMYTSKAVIDAIENALKVTPKLECVKINDEWYLNSVEICLDPTLNFINCPHHHSKDGEKSLRTLIHGIFERIQDYSTSKAKKTFKPVNTLCGDNDFFLP